MKKWLPLLILVFLMITVYLTGATHYISFESIKSHRLQVLEWIDTHPILMPCLFILLYAVTVALSLPGGAILTLLGGFFFGVPWSTLYVVIGATLGATTLFLAARLAIGSLLKKRVSPFLDKMQKGFEKNVASYLLFLRLVPLFPFWLVNLTPAFFKVRASTYIWTTFIGIIPGSYVFTQAGSGLGAIFDHGETLSLSSIFNAQIQLALLVLALFALIPIFVKKYYHDR